MWVQDRDAPSPLEPQAVWGQEVGSGREWGSPRATRPADAGISLFVPIWAAEPGRICPPDVMGPRLGVGGNLPAPPTAAAMAEMGCGWRG